MDKDIAIKVDHVSMHFNMSSEKIDSIKEYFIKAMKKELFFKDFIAVNDACFEIKKGEVFGIIGTNGSGKSTLLKIISGILAPTEGKVKTDGIIAPLIELGAGFDGDLTARENIFLNGAILGYEKEFIEEKFTSIVDFAELWDFLDMPIKNYSSGMVARIAFAIATVVKPDILIVDEILAVGDFLFQQKCEQRIRELMSEGTTVVIVSHSIEQIESLCDRVLWIEKSRVRMIGKTYEVCSAYRSLQDIKVNESINVRETIVKEKCFICGEVSEFKVDKGVTLVREACCSKCGCSIRINDMIKTYLAHGLNISTDTISIKMNKNILNGKKILNCCSSGIFKDYFNELGGYQALSGTEKERCKALYNLPYANDIFDLIINEEIMAYFEKPEKVFQECKRVLKKGGILLLTVPIHEGEKTKFRKNLKNNIYRGEGMKVYVDWGDDICDYINKTGLHAKLYKCHKFYEESEITNIDRDFEKSLKTHPFYFYKYNSNVIIAIKE